MSCLPEAAPFRGPKYNTPLKKILAHARTQPRSIRECAPNVPAQLAQVVERMLAKSPSDRFATPAEVAQALAPFTAGGNLPALAARYASAPSRPKVGDPRALTETLGSSARGGTKPDSPPPRRPRRRTLASAAAALVACAAIVIIVKDRHDKELARLEVPDAATLSSERKPGLKPDSANSKPHPSADVLAKLRPQSADQPLDPKPASVPKRSVEATTSHLGPAGFAGHPLAIAGLRGWNIVKRGPANFDKHAAFHPKEPIVANAGAGGLIRICDAATLAVRRVMMTPDGEIEDLVWSPDGALLATVDNAFVHLWSFPSGRLLHRLDSRPPGEGGEFFRHSPIGYGTLIRFAPNGTMLASAARDRQLQVWDVGAAKLLKAFNFRGEIESFAWDANSQRLAVLELSEPALKLIDVATGAEQSVSIEVQRNATSDARGGRDIGAANCDWSADGTKIACNVEDGVIRVFDSNSLEAVGPPIPSDSGIYDLAWSPDGRFLASANLIFGGGHPFLARVWDAATMKMVREYKTSAIPRHARWSPDGEKLVVSGTFNEFASISIWACDRDDALVPDQPRPGYADEATVAWVPEGRRFGIGVGNRAEIWDAATCAQVEAYSSAGGRPLKMAWSPDGEKLATAIRGHRFGLWNTSTHEFLDSVAYQSLRPRLAWLSDSDTLVTNGGDGDAIQRWQTNDGRIKPLGPLEPRLMSTLAVSPNHGQFAALTTDWKEIAFYDLAGEKLLRGVPAYICHDLSWSQERNLVAATHGDCCFLHDPTGKLPSRQLFHPFLELIGVAWSPTGKQIAGACRQWGVVVWDVDSGRLVHSLYGHDSLVWSTTWSPDGGVLASHGSDGTTRFWNPANGRLWGTLRRVDDEVAVIGSNGHVRASQPVTDQLAYVAQTDEGQATLTQAEFEAKFGWKNDPDKVRMIDFDEAKAKR